MLWTITWLRSLIGLRLFAVLHVKFRSSTVLPPGEHCCLWLACISDCTMHTWDENSRSRDANAIYATCCCCYECLRRVALLQEQVFSQPQSVRRLGPTSWTGYTYSLLHSRVVTNFYCCQWCWENFKESYGPKSTLDQLQLGWSQPNCVKRLQLQYMVTQNWTLMWSNYLTLFSGVIWSYKLFKKGRHLHKKVSHLFSAKRLTTR